MVKYTQGDDIMTISEAIGNSIERLMIDNGISNRQLAELLGVTHPTISKYLRGEQVIDSEKLSIIAKYFNKPFDYFFSNNSEELPFLFRADKPALAINEVDVDQIKLKYRQYIDVVGKPKYNYIPPKYSLNLDSKKLNDEDETFLEKVANEQRKYFNIEAGIPDNYYSVVEEKGINVISCHFDNESFFGASSLSELFGSFIFINSHKTIPEERQLFTLFHEYGHLLFHHADYKSMEYNPYYLSNADLKEKIVNSFAGYFLLPRQLVKEYIDIRGKNVDVFEMKNHFKVSIQTLYIALRKYDLITQKQSSEFWAKANKNNWLKFEPFPIAHVNHLDKNVRLVSFLKNLYVSEQISSNKITEVLGLDMMETRKIIKKWSGADDHYERFA